MNMFVTIWGIVAMFVALTIISFTMDGNTGIAATTLSTSIDSDATSITVTSTEGFLSIDYLIIGNENLCYSAKTATTFTGITRGCNQTEASDHIAGSRVYNEATGMLNTVVGFNIAEAMSTAGVVQVPFMLAGAIPRTFAKMIAWDYSFLEGELWGVQLVLIKFIFLYPLSAAFMLGFIVIVINVFMGVARLFTG